ncbi:IclR family transcriptional regulator (plasmid) [Skermanella rosea]|uniref:IclR family transcriptional regulator n=1 Tax=Skermanella rosea TaxID=1817965 RepID=UPI001932DECB|nr:IclR family transcriptional regulator [Skermanella rosea]UEM07815.1 IclR family transcriptional regulator [Skermanella rosea]
MKKRVKQPTADVPALDDDGPFAGDRQFVGALYRGLEILRCFRPTDGPLGNQELSQRCGLPKPTVSRLTYTLSKLGYLVYLEDSGKYRIGVPVLGLGYACLGGLRIRDTAQPYMDELARHAGSGVLVGLGGRDDLSMIYVACARASSVVSLQLDVGSRISLARSSMGRAYLAGADEAERTSLLQQIRAKVGEEHWPRHEEEILRAIEQVRTRGFCTNIGEWQTEVNSVAVPLRTPRHEMPALAFNCGGPAYLLSRERLEQDLGPRLAEMARKIQTFGST